MILVNTGNGKGKTTAAVGQIVRSLGRGWKVCVIQLFKCGEFYAEQKILKKIKNLDFYLFCPKHPECFRNIKPKQAEKYCKLALSKAADVLTGRNNYRLVVLEEFNIALRDGFIKFADLEAVLKNNKIKADIIITGRGAPKGLIEMADYVTDMRLVKHPYYKGAKAKKGIEF